MPGQMRLYLCVACSLFACARDVATGTRCSAGDTACGASLGGLPSRGSPPVAGAGAISAGDDNGAAGNPSVARSDSALSVHVEDIQKMTIELVTLACAGDCAD